MKAQHIMTARTLASQRAAWLPPEATFVVGALPTAPAPVLLAPELPEPVILVLGAAVVGWAGADEVCPP